MITFVNVRSAYPDGTKGLDNVTFSLDDGSFTGLLGPSGAGKTTILWHIMGELIPYSGHINCMGYNPSTLPKGELVKYRRMIGFVPQNLLLLNHRTVYENVNMILRGMGLSQKDAEIRTQNVLDIAGIRDRQKSMPTQLSGGEQQRVAIARALSMNPKVLLADEPTGNLDPQRSEEIMTLFKRINELGITVLVSTHEWHLIRSLGANLLYIEDGQIRPVPEDRKRNKGRKDNKPQDPNRADKEGKYAKQK